MRNERNATRLLPSGKRVVADDPRAQDRPLLGGVGVELLAAEAGVWSSERRLGLAKPDHLLQDVSVDAEDLFRNGKKVTEIDRAPHATMIPIRHVLSVL